MTAEVTKKRVLVVDDEEDMIWTLQKNLPTKDLPISISIASSGEEALDVLKNSTIDLIVTDIRMPGMSGIDLLIEVKNNYPNIGVIVMTAFPSTESKAEVIEKGGLRFIEKPFDIHEMRRFIRNALAKDSPSRSKVSGIKLFDIVQINNLAKATSALRVKCNGHEGAIYFSKGNIVHATCNDLVGEEAFYSLMRLKGGKVKSFKPKKMPGKSIHTPVGPLVLKGVLLSEKGKGDVDYLEDLDLGITARVASEVIDGPGNFPATLSDMESGGQIFHDSNTPLDNKIVKELISEEEEMEEVNELLGEFTNVPGVNTACLVGRDGFLLHSAAMTGIDSEMIGAIASSGFGASEAMGSQLEKGMMSMTMVEYDNGPVMLAPVGGDAFLVIVADKDANLGMIRLKIKKHSRDIEQRAGL